MPRSFYKGEPLGKTPACAICMGRGQGPRALLHLPLGVSVWLCAAHRDPAWLRSRTGRDLVVLCHDQPYFSAQDWFVGTLPINTGIPEAVRSLIKSFGYNDLESLRAVLIS